MPQEAQYHKEHRVEVVSRERLSATGVSDVECFSDTGVVLITSMGKMNVKGKGLSVKGLDTEGGTFSVTGSIDSIEYKRSAKSGGLSALFG